MVYHPPSCFVGELTGLLCSLSYSFAERRYHGDTLHRPIAPIVAFSCSKMIYGQSATLFHLGSDTHLTEVYVEEVEDLVWECHLSPHTKRLDWL